MYIVKLAARFGAPTTVFETVYRAFLAAGTGSVSEENCVIRGKSRTGACRFLEELGGGVVDEVSREGYRLGFNLPKNFVASQFEHVAV